jgi:hypothetical protein
LAPFQTRAVVHNQPMSGLSWCLCCARTRLCWERGYECTTGTSSGQRLIGIGEFGALQRTHRSVRVSKHNLRHNPSSPPKQQAGPLPATPRQLRAMCWCLGASARARGLKYISAHPGWLVPLWQHQDTAGSGALHVCIRHTCTTPDPTPDPAGTCLDSAGNYSQLRVLCWCLGA